MRRVSVVGVSGAGKTTLARALADRLGVPVLELDAVFHQPGWTELPEPEFRARVAAVVAADGWVVDGSYSAVLDLVWERADAVVWLDYPRPLVMRRVVARSAVRLVARTDLWNGNRESIAALLSRDPHRSIIRWAWTRHGPYRERFARATADARWSGLRVVRLTSPRQAAAFLASTANPHGGRR